MKLYLARHGRTDMNEAHRLQGKTDTTLNENGRKQAEATARILKEKGVFPTVILSSPLQRAIETAMLLTGKERSQVETDDRLEEMSFGVYEGENMDLVDPDFTRRFFDEPHTYEPPENGESYSEMLERVASLMEDLREKMKKGIYGEEDQVLLVSHGALGHGILAYLANTPVEDYWVQTVNNCAVVELHLSTEKRKSQNVPEGKTMGKHSDFEDSYEMLWEGYKRV